MSSESIDRANRDYRDGKPGFYVANLYTDLAVAGPFEREVDAANDCVRRNLHPPSLNELHVVEVNGHAS